MLNLCSLTFGCLENIKEEQGVFLLFLALLWLLFEKLSEIPHLCIEKKPLGAEMKSREDKNMEVTRLPFTYSCVDNKNRSLREPHWINTYGIFSDKVEAKQTWEGKKKWLPLSSEGDNRRAFSLASPDHWGVGWFLLFFPLSSLNDVSYKVRALSQTCFFWVKSEVNRWKSTVKQLLGYFVSE